MRGIVRRNLFWLNDEQWKRIEPRRPTDVRGIERVDDRRVISGIVHVLKSGCRWCDCPPEYGPATTIYNRFVRWAGLCLPRRCSCMVDLMSLDPSLAMVSQQLKSVRHFTIAHLGQSDCDEIKPSFCCWRDDSR